MPNRININGVITAAEDAKIPILDHGLLFGDSVYETLRTPTRNVSSFAPLRAARTLAGIDLKLIAKTKTGRNPANFACR
jgi:hypothetical protein